MATATTREPGQYCETSEKYAIQKGYFYRNTLTIEKLPPWTLHSLLLDLQVPIDKELC